MPTTRKKAIKTIYKEEDSEEQDGGDFSDSGSDAKFSAESSSDEDEAFKSQKLTGDEFDNKGKNKQTSRKPVRKSKFAKTLISKINKQSFGEIDNVDASPVLFSVKDLSEADKILPPILNLSESDSSDNESPMLPTKKITTKTPLEIDKNSKTDSEVITEYKDVWSTNLQDDSEEIAKKTFMELEKHKSKIEETKATIQSYTSKMNLGKEHNVNDLLALGEENVTEEKVLNKKNTSKKRKDDSESEMEDWEEVKESRELPKQGIQLLVEFPDAGCRKSKKVDIEMMMKRKINRVKKEYQVYMHKVHVLCYLGHGNYVSRVLNDQELMAAALSLVPSKDCYPGERIDMKYIEQITTWYKDKLTLKQDKNEHKFKPKAPPLKTILLNQIKTRVVTTRKYLVFIFISMLRAIGLQCRIMFNFVTLPIKPPSSELCSLSTKTKEDKNADEKSKSASTDQKDDKKKLSKHPGLISSRTKSKKRSISQVDGNDDYCYSSDLTNENDFENIMQIDGNNDPQTIGTRRTRSAKREKTNDNQEVEDVSPPKISKKSTSRMSPKPVIEKENKTFEGPKRTQKRKNDDTSESLPLKADKKQISVIKEPKASTQQHSQTENLNNSIVKSKTPEKSNTRPSSLNKSKAPKSNETSVIRKSDKLQLPNIVVTDSDQSSKYFNNSKPADGTSITSNRRLSRKRSQTANNISTQNSNKLAVKEIATKQKGRTKSAPDDFEEESKYFIELPHKTNTRRSKNDNMMLDDKKRVSHRDLTQAKTRLQNDVTGDLVTIIKNRIKSAKEEAKKGIVKGKIKQESDVDSDYLPEKDPNPRKSESDDDFKPIKVSPKPSTSRKIIDRRVLSPDIDLATKKIDIWCEIFVEELEQWIPVDVVKGKIHITNSFYNNATHPVCYIVGWDNNNYLKDLTRRYVPHWNTVTRKQRAEPLWWTKAVEPWLGPRTARDREEDEQLDRMQLEAPLPKSIAEYKNHPLYALKRHLLKFEALYPPDAAVLGFVRGEAVYARECVHVCRSRDTWLKEAKVVKLGQQPYKVVKARPKWDKLSNKVITDKPLEVFGPWQVQDYEPPVAENGVVPRNAYGNVELFKECMLPKGTVHLKLPSLNRVAKKLNIDCAPAMTGFDFNGGWSHPVFDGFVVCKEFEEILTDAWVKDQEEQERREREKIETRVYGNWKRLIKGLLIRERLKSKYGFEGPSTAQATKTKSKGPRLVVRKK